MQVEKDLKSIHIADPVISDKLVRLNKHLFPYILIIKFLAIASRTTKVQLPKQKEKLAKYFHHLLRYL